MDWASRAVLLWRLSNSMDVSFCVSALEEALARFGKPDIFNTDQGSQFTRVAFTEVLLAARIASWLAFYNTRRPHRALANRAPMAVWRASATHAAAGPREADWGREPTVRHRSKYGYGSGKSPRNCITAS